MCAIAFQALRRFMARTVVVALGLAATGAATRAADAVQIQAEPARTGKERLGGKGSDEQRVDNCKVPRNRRGDKPRADECADDVGAAPSAERRPAINDNSGAAVSAAPHCRAASSRA